MIETYYKTSAYFILFGTSLSFLICLIELSKKQKQKFSYVFIFCFILSLLQINLGLIVSGDYEQTILKFPLLVIFIPVSIFLLGPFVLRTIFYMTDFIEEKKISNYHFIPAIISIIPGILFLFQNSDYQYEILQSTFKNRDFNIANTIFFLSWCHISSYFIYLLLFIYRFNKKYKIIFSTLLFSLAISIYSVSLLLGTGYFLQNFLLFSMGGNVIVFSEIQAILFSSRYPDFFTSLKDNIKEQKYEELHRFRNNIDIICERIKHLMEEKKIFTNENLKLSNLAEELLISSHQLSYILNNQFGKKFNEFINGYRIEAAKILLLEEKNKTILNIAYQVGFNTKVTFNSQFLTSIGMTPSDYRKNKNKGKRKSKNS